tara:strand:- start:483 stop:665 length:183 start_codon:yes stop_codon:yes gene_type:complete
MDKDTRVLRVHKILLSPNAKKELKRIALDHDVGVGRLMGEILTNFVNVYDKDEENHIEKP